MRRIRSGCCARAARGHAAAAPPSSVMNARRFTRSPRRRGRAQSGECRGQARLSGFEIYNQLELGRSQVGLPWRIELLARILLRELATDGFEGLIAL